MEDIARKSGEAYTRLPSIKREFKKEDPDIPTQSGDDWLKDWTVTKDVKNVDVEIPSSKLSVADDDYKTSDAEDTYEDYSDGQEDGDTKTNKEELPESNSEQRRKVFMRNKKTIMHKVLVRKLCQGVEEVSERLDNLCQFKCTVCDKKLLSSYSLQHHFRNVHEERFCLAMISQCIIKVVGFRCKICCEITLCDAFFIHRHITKAHKMLIYQYTEKFGYSVSKKLPVATYSEKVIGNLCKYKCHDCGDLYNNRTSLISHKKKHKEKTRRSIKSLIKRVNHHCKLCNNSILCEMPVISRHLQTMHAMSVREYCKQTGCSLIEKAKKQIKPSDVIKKLKVSKITYKSLCIFECKICNKRLHSTKGMGKHMRTNHKNISFKLLDMLISGFSYKCEKCSALMLCDTGVIATHYHKVHHGKGYGSVTSPACRKRLMYDEHQRLFLREIPISSKIWDSTVVPVTNIPLQERTSRIGNLCTFKCPKCDCKIFSNWAAITRHCRVEHNYIIRFRPSCLVEARYHSCLICPKAVLADRALLARHLFKAAGQHKFSLSEYEKCFIKHGGQVLPTLRSFTTT